MKRTTETFINELKVGPERLSFSEAMSKLTYLVLSETLFSGEIDDDVEAILADVAYFLEKLSAADPLDFLGAPDWVPRPTRFRGGNATQRLRNAVRGAARTGASASERARMFPMISLHYCSAPETARMVR